MIGWLLHSAWLYDVVQVLAGERQLERRLARHLEVLPADSRLVDVGGGTGLLARHATVRAYVCMDLDLAKLQRFRHRHPGGIAVVADAAHSPLATGSVDVVLCAKVLHHLDDATLQNMLGESLRVLRPGGVLILADAVRSARWIPRLLWRLDRGSHPRTAAEIRQALPSACRVTGWEEHRIAVFHDFVLCAAVDTMNEPPGSVHRG